jgi:integrase
MMKVQPIYRLKDVRAIKKMIASSPRDSAIFAVGINTNLRASDIVNMTIGQVRGVKPGNEIEIIEKKTGKKRRVTFNEDAATAIQRLLVDLGDRHENSDKLFQGQRGPLTVKTITRLVKRWCVDINLKGNYGSHTMRKTFGVHQRQRCGTSIPELMVMFNHSSQRQTLDYLCIQPEEIKDAYMKLSY